MSKSAGNEYFGDGGILAQKVAAKVAEFVAIGPDGNFWLYEAGVFRPSPDIIRHRMARLLGNRYRASYVNTVEDVLRSFEPPRIEATAVKLGAWEPYINLKNGMYNWQTDTFEAHDPRFLSTVQLDVEYMKLAECPTFDAWLSDVVPADLQPLVWETLGYLFMLGNPKQTAVLLVGPGGTGKSTFLDVVEKVIDRKNVAAQSLRNLTENRFAASSLFGKQANICGDIDSAYLKDSSLFKQLTGGDTMTAERKYQDGFEFRPYAVPVFSANKVWRSSDDTEGYFRRWIVLPFTHRVDRSKPFDIEALYAEAPGIFRKAMEALRQLHVRGEFVPSKTAREAREQFEQDSDPIRLWLAEDNFLKVDRGNESLRSQRTIVFARYKVWCKDNGIESPKSGPEFYKSLRALGFTERKSGTYYLLGLEVYMAGATV